jgi:uncharacterized protein YfkK (UPF0435 family)
MKAYEQQRLLEIEKKLKEPSRISLSEIQALKRELVVLRKKETKK